MSRQAAARALVRAMRPVIEAHHERRGMQVVRATITYLHGTPGFRRFESDMHHYGLTLTQDNVTFGQSVESYDLHTGLKVHDTLVCVELDENDYTAIEVESDTDLT